MLDRGRNEITISTSKRARGTAGLTIFLNDRMIDVQKPVVVRSQEGTVLFEGRPVPDYWTVLETLDARLDRTMVFDRRIEL